ncbi:Uncharacterized protein BN1090_A2_01012 [Aneurinibacillus migulanus]|nr:Uncharacterized protein BN1090_A2_01012 [Aneurinibacillus migulanus]
MEKNYWRSSKVFFIVLNIFLVSFSSVASADNGEATKPIVENTGYTFPAEWEKQSAVWLVWEWDEFGESTTDEQHTCSNSQISIPDTINHCYTPNEFKKSSYRHEPQGILVMPPMLNLKRHA